MSNHSVIEHRANYHYFKLEEDYVLVCSFGKQYPQCKAAILAVLEHWINDKRAKNQGEYIYLSYPEWVEALYGLFRRSHIMACLNELVEEGFITRRPCRRFGKDTYEYTLNIPVLAARLKSLPERKEKNTRPNLHPSKFTRVQKQTGSNLDASTRPNLNASERDPSKFGRNIDSLTEIPSPIDTERESAIAPPAHSTLHAEITLSEEDYAPDNDAGGEETVKQQAVSYSNGYENGSHSHSEQTSSVVLSQGAAPAQEQAPGGAASAAVPQGSGPRASGRRRARDQDIPIPAEAEAIMDAWDSIFKHAQPRTEKHIAAAVALVPAHPTRDDLKACKDWLFTTDNPHKPWFRKKGVCLQDVADNYTAWQSVAPDEEAEPEEYSFAWYDKYGPDAVIGPLQA